MDQEVTYEQKNNRKDFHFDHIYFENPQRFGSIRLFQVGDLSCQGGYVVNEHEQFCYELSYIVSGRGWFKAGGASHAVKEGDIVLNVPGKNTPAGRTMTNRSGIIMSGSILRKARQARKARKANRRPWSRSGKCSIGRRSPSLRTCWASKLRSPASSRSWST
ncbi:cupin domain-containing protein [Cohnella rhizosphaerae]|uniref:cupin domain-containing protein n=1 Tax=Cohnella rhizosphaerae TaxID=1457232 RepID=UPI003B8A5B85